MRTKFDIKINAMQFTIQEQTIETPEIHINTELDTTIGELRDLYSLQKEVLKETPALAETFAKEFLESLIRTYTHFEQLDSSHKERELQERRIDEWFREYFLAPDITEEAKKAFSDFFGEKALRIDFFEMALETKNEFFKTVCDKYF